MNRNKTLLVGLAVAALLIGGYAIGEAYFFPERATLVEEPLDDASDGSTVLKTGSFTGKTGHTVSGTVSLIEDDEGYALRFEDYDQTQGPDVFVYLTPAEDPDTTAEVRAGRKVLIDGGADGGESTKEGTFIQRLPDDIDPTAYNGVAIWCDRFSVPFGSAPLHPA